MLTLNSKLEEYFAVLLACLTWKGPLRRCWDSDAYLPPTVTTERYTYPHYKQPVKQISDDMSHFRREKGQVWGQREMNFFQQKKSQAF